MVKRLVRYWWVMVLAVMIGGAASVAIALIKPPLYKSECVILYREVIRSDVIYGQDQTRDRDDAATRLQEAALARPRPELIIRELDLYPDVVQERGAVEAIDRMRRHIEFKAKGGDVFYISFLGDTPELAYEVTQQLAETLIQEEAIARAEQVTATEEFLERELDSSKEALAERETAVSKFLEKHPEFALDTLNMAAPGEIYRARAQSSLLQSSEPIVAKKSSDPQLSSLYREEAGIRQRLRDVERKGARPELVAQRDRADSDLQSARRDLADKRRRFTDKHPDVTAATARVRLAERSLERAKEAVRRDLAASKNPKKRDLEKQLGSVQSRIRDRRAQLRRKEKEEKEQRAQTEKENQTKETAPKSDTIVDLETEWARLYRELEEARERYSVLEGKHFRAAIDANSQIAAQASQMSIIDPAYLPMRPFGAPKRLIVMAGVVIAGVLGFGFALLLALMDDRLFERAEVERLGILPVLVMVPRDGRGKKKRQRPPTIGGDDPLGGSSV